MHDVVNRKYQPRRRPSFKTHPLNKKYYNTNGRTTLPVVIRKLPKDKAITDFEIHLEDNTALAGNNINGKVCFNVRRPMSVWYVELIIEGTGTTYYHRGAYGSTELQKETYLKKQTLVMGSGKVNRVVHLQPGTYNTEFSYNLPEDIPASLTYVNPKTLFGINIQYRIKIRICDDMGMVQVDKKEQNTKHLVKVLKKTSLPFRVYRPFNMLKHPLAYTCLSHTETFDTSCLPVENMPAQITLSTDRSVYQVGDRIELHIEAETESRHYEENHVKWIKLELIQNATLKYLEDNKTKEKKFTTIIVMFQKRIRLGGNIHDHNTISECDVFFPIPKQLVPSIITNCKILEVSYTLRVTIHFNKFGGTLLSEFPLEIGPSGAGASGDGRESIPIFDKQALMEFPRFRATPSSNFTWRNSTASANSGNKGPTVITKYYNWLDSLFLLTNEVK